MELIYVWIEEFRNIKKCAFYLNRDFYIEISDEGFLSDEEVKASCQLNHKNKIRKGNEYLIENKIEGVPFTLETEPNEKDVNVKIPQIRVFIKKNIDSISIFGDQIINLTAVVGKNGVGKSNFLTCIGDLIESLDNSSFLMIFYDKNTNEYIFECNQIAILYDNHKINAVKGSYQPETTIVRFPNTDIKVFKEFNEVNSIEFITIAEKLNEMLYPSANNFHSRIGRFGLHYSNCGLLYQFMYLSNYSNDENFNNNNIKINLEINYAFKQRHEYIVKILPSEGLKLNQDSLEEKRRNKATFMLYFFETVIYNMRFVNNEIVESEVNELLTIINSCDNNINVLISKYKEIKEKTIQIRTKLMENHMENHIDINTCYVSFVDQLEKVIEKVDERCFESPKKCSIDILSVFSETEQINNIKKLLELADEEDVCLEFLNNNITIKLSSISDGIRYLLYLYSTIHKCFKHNGVNKFETIILILDEPEVHLHPEWSRKLVYNIIDFLRQEFADIKFQIILSTHSPFVLSDIPKDNIIFLEKDNDGKSVIKQHELNTFGANIHTLLKDSFFMESTIGEFAKYKINEVINFLTENEYAGDMNKQRAKYIISNIGEDIIKNKLKKTYAEKHPEDLVDIQQYKDKIVQLQKAICNGDRIDKKKLLMLQLELKTTFEIITEIIKLLGNEND
jgi:predicted ATP-binding protein involved in virulence